MAAVSEFVAVGAVTVSPVYKTCTTDQGESVSQFETGRAVNRQVFHIGKTVAQIRHIGLCNITVKLAQIRNNRFAFLIERQVFSVALIADTCIKFMRTTESGIVAVQSQREILVAVFAAVTI